MKHFLDNNHYVKCPKYGVFVSLRIQSECRKIWTRKNSVFGHFSSTLGKVTFKVPKYIYFTQNFSKIDQNLKLVLHCCSNQFPENIGSLYLDNFSLLKFKFINIRLRLS